MMENPCTIPESATWAFITVMLAMGIIFVLSMRWAYNVGYQDGRLKQFLDRE